MFITKKYILVVFLFLLTNHFTQAQEQLEKPFTVILDPGHGGHDSGTEGNKKYKENEKDVVLKVSNLIGQLIEQNHRDIRVVYTRTSDVYIQLHERSNIANKENGDLFISIHCNANKNTKANGCETYVLGTHKNAANFEVAKKENSVIFLEEDYTINYAGFDPNDPTMPIAFTISTGENFENSLEFASILQEEMHQKTKLHDRGVRQAGFLVLHQTSIPSVLIEMGFLSNDKDAAFLMSEDGQKKMAQSILSGILKYKANWDQRRVNLLSSANASSPTKENSDGEIFFAVQFATMSQSVSTDPENFKGLSDVGFYVDNNTYKYYYKKTQSMSEAIKNKKEVESKGYQGAFVIAFEGEKRIDIAQAKKKLKK